MKKRTPTKKKLKENSIEEILKSYTKNLFGISYYFENIGTKAEVEDEGSLKTSSEFIKECLEASGIELDMTKESSEEKKVKDKNEEKTVEDIPIEKINDLLSRLDKFPKISSSNFEILASSSFLMLNNYFEFLLADLLTYHYYKFKDSLNSKEFKVSLKEMNEYDTIEELETSLILKEVEAMLVEYTFDNLLNHFKNKLDIGLADDIIDWDFIKEARERRHLIVHNGSIVNKKYLTRTKNPDNIKQGDKVFISKEYFLNSLREFKLAGIVMSYNCWGKWDKDKIDEAIYHLVEESFDALKQEELDFVCRMHLIGR